MRGEKLLNDSQLAYRFVENLSALGRRIRELLTYNIAQLRVFY